MEKVVIDIRNKNQKDKIYLMVLIISLVMLKKFNVKNVQRMYLVNEREVYM